MNNLENSISYSLDGSESPDIYPFLPYILQDLWELGASPGIIAEVITQNNIDKSIPQLKILDLGCGKGAVSVTLAKKFNALVHGVDGMEDFIHAAKIKAHQLGVDHLCTFESGDIRDYAKQQHDFDIVILAAVGTVFGNMEETISALAKCIKPGGHLIIDDGYISDKADFESDKYIKESNYFAQIKNSGFEIVDSIIADEKYLEDNDSEIYDKIKMRIDELIAKYPDKRTEFENYLLKQESENNIIENYLVNVCMLLRRKTGE